MAKIKRIADQILQIPRIIVDKCLGKHSKSLHRPTIIIHEKIKSKTTGLLHD